jgi:hypothetical protein
MSQHRNRIIVGTGLAALLLVSYAMPSRHADFHLSTAAKDEANPRKLEAAVDIGKVAISTGISWAGRLAP